VPLANRLKQAIPFLFERPLVFGLPTAEYLGQLAQEMLLPLPNQIGMDSIFTSKFIDGALLADSIQSHFRFEVGARIGGAVVPWTCSFAVIVLQLAPPNGLTQFLGSIINHGPSRLGVTYLGLLCSTKQALHYVDRCFLHVRRHMGIDPECNRDVCMSEHLTPACST
jgi:hypothetical protein